MPILIENKQRFAIFAINKIFSIVLRRYGSRKALFHIYRISLSQLRVSSISQLNRLLHCLVLWISWILFHTHSKSELKPFFNLGINIKTEVQSIHKHNTNTSSTSSHFRNHNNDYNMLLRYTPCSNFTSHIRTSSYYMYIRIQINAYLLYISCSTEFLYTLRKRFLKKIWYAWVPCIYEGLLKSFFDIL